MLTVAFLILAVFSILIWGNALKKKLTPTLSSYSLVLAISLKTILIYGLMNVFNYTTIQISIYLVSVFLFFKFKLFQRSNFVNLFKENTVFLAFASFWLVLTLKGKVIYNDEFFWASFVKHLFVFDRYWTADNFLVNSHYVPGVSLWERFFIGTEFVNEQALLFSLGLIFAAVFNVLIDAKTSLKKLFLTFFLFTVFIYNFSPIGISSIYVDTTVGLVLAVCLYAIYDFEGENIFVPLVLFIFFGLLKDTAFLLSILCVFIFGLKLIRLKMHKKSHYVFLFAGLALIFINYLMWQRYLAIVGIHPTDHVKELMKQDLVRISVRTKENWTIFVDAITSRVFPSSKISFIHGNLLLVFSFFILFFIYIRKKYEFLIGYVLGFIGYTMAILIFWFYVTVEYEGKILASYERYFGTYFVGFALFTIKIIVDEGLWSKKYFKYPFLVLCLVFFPSPQMFYPASAKKIIPSVVANKLNLNVKFDREAVEYIDSLVVRNTAPESRLWFIWKKRGGFEMLVSRYEVAPRQFVVQDYIIGDPEDAGDVWTKKLSIGDFFAHAQLVDYVVLGLIDDNFIKNYQSAFLQTPKSAAIYQKVNTPEGVRLSEIAYKDARQ